MFELADGIEAGAGVARVVAVLMVVVSIARGRIVGYASFCRGGRGEKTQKVLARCFSNMN